MSADGARQLLRLSTNVYQEGVRIPPIKIFERGKINKAAMTLLMANMRVPKSVKATCSLAGCLQGGRAANQSAAGKIRDGDSVSGRCRSTWTAPNGGCASASRHCPTVITMPRTTWNSSTPGKLDPVLARLRLTVAGDQLIADFAGTNPQVQGVVNCSLAVAGAGVVRCDEGDTRPGGCGSTKGRSGR